MATEEQDRSLPDIQSESFLMKLGPFSPPELHMFADAVRKMSATNSDTERVEIVRDFARNTMRAVELQERVANSESELESLLPGRGRKSGDRKAGMLELGKTIGLALDQLSDASLVKTVMDLPPISVADFRSVGLPEEICARLSEVLPAEITWDRDSQELFHAYLVGRQLVLQVRKHGLTLEQAVAKIVSNRGVPAGAIDDWARVGFAGDDLQLLADIAKLAVRAKPSPTPGCDCSRCTALRAILQAEAEVAEDLAKKNAAAVPAVDPAFEAAAVRAEEAKAAAEVIPAVTP